MSTQAIRVTAAFAVLVLLAIAQGQVTRDWGVIIGALLVATAFLVSTRFEMVVTQARVIARTVWDFVLSCFSEPDIVRDNRLKEVLTVTRGELIALARITNNFTSRNTAAALAFVTITLMWLIPKDWEAPVGFIGFLAIWAATLWPKIAHYFRGTAP